MAIGRGTWGLALLGAAGLVWQLGVFAGRVDAVEALTILAIGVGFLGAAAALQGMLAPGAFRGGWALAVLGIAGFLANSSPLRFSPYLVPTWVFTLGCVVAGWGALRPDAAGSGRALRVGSAVMAVGAFLWLPSDAIGGGWLWEPGNALAFAGAALFASAPATPDGPPGP